MLLIPGCILTLNSKMREKHHGAKKFLVIGQLIESGTKHANQLIEGWKDQIVQIFLPEFFPEVFDWIELGTISRLKDQPNVAWDLQLF